MLRKFQNELKEVAEGIAKGSGVRNILAYVTQGGGKSSIAAIMNAALPELRICWIVPRDTLRRQGAKGYEDEAGMKRYGNHGELRVVRGQRDPLDFGQGFITTYQSVSMAHQSEDSIFLYELKRAGYILILDECHHVPLISDPDKIIDEREKAYYEAIRPLVEQAKVVVFTTGSLYRGDNNRVAFLPYRSEGPHDVVDMAPREGWAFVTYGRRHGLKEEAILPIEFSFSSGSVSWIDDNGSHSLRDLREASHEQQSRALFSALRKDFAYKMLDKAIARWLQYKAEVYPPAKLLVISPNIEVAEEYLKHIKTYRLGARIAHSDIKRAATEIDHFRGDVEPVCDIIITVAMCYEGLDVKQITHVACLTEIRSLPWIEQAISRANRVDMGDPRKTRGFVFVPNDNPLRMILDQIARDDPAGLINYGNEMAEPPEPVRGKRLDKALPVDSALTGEETYLMDGENLVPISYRRQKSSEEKPKPLAHEREESLRQRVHTHVTRVSNHDLKFKIKVYKQIKDKWGKELSRLSEEQLKEVLRWFRDKEFL